MHTKKRPILLVIGTRPEGIKMAPVYYALKKADLPVAICSTMQHNQMLVDVLKLFSITPDYELHVMRLHQDLFYLTQSILQKTKELFSTIQPSLVLVQGDTTSSMAASLAAFYLKIPVGHVEAGLRTDDVQAPFPEEMNRRIISSIARYHFAPTQHAVGNLRMHGVDPKYIFLTGNTIVDAIILMQEKIAAGLVSIRDEIKHIVKQCAQRKQKLIVLTMHRRESLEHAITTILQTLKTYVEKNPNVFCVYPFHPNPAVVSAIERIGLHGQNWYLCEPLLYSDMIYLLDKADLVVTDSGGLQEEAVSLAKPVLVLREKTERMEGIAAGLAHIVGFDSHAIFTHLEKILQSPNADTLVKSEEMLSIYGDGHAAEKIVAAIQAHHADKIVQVSNQAKDSVNFVDKKYVTSQKEEKNMKKVSVLGLGYIGLPTSIVLADHGFEVIGFDTNKDRVDKINRGDPVIQEPEVYEKLQIVLTDERFRATCTLEKSNFFIIAVPTPLKHNNHANLDYVFEAAKSIVPVLEKENVVLIESTIPVGTTQNVAQFLQEQTGMQAGEDFYVVHSPERVLPGNIFYELMHNDRIIGGINKKSVVKAKDMYTSWVLGNLYLTDAQTAEMVKLVENSSRDVQLAFAHQVASMAYEIGLNPYEVIELANKHPRVQILHPTCGVGGHCIAVDPWFLMQTFKNTQLLHAARDVNDAKPHEITDFIYHVIREWQHKNNDKKCMLLLLGMTYKPDVDDIRESPAIKIAKNFAQDASIQVLICEPHVNKEELVLHLSNEQEIVSVQEGIAQAHIIVFLVAHKRFKVIDRKIFQDKKVLDFCGLFYESRLHADKQEIMFWPAQSMLDFFIAHQELEPPHTDALPKEKHI